MGGLSDLKNLQTTIRDFLVEKQRAGSLPKDLLPTERLTGIITIKIHAMINKNKIAAHFFEVLFAELLKKNRISTLEKVCENCHQVIVMSINKLLYCSGKCRNQSH